MRGGIRFATIPMKLRFGIDVAVLDRVRATLDARCEARPVGRRLSDIYLDTPDDELAGHGVTLRYRRRVRLTDQDSARPAGRERWRRQEFWEGDERVSLGKLGIKRLKHRLDATFAVRIERWTWRLDEGWARVSLDRGEITTGRAEAFFTELRVTCDRRRADDATRLAVELGATRLARTKVRERGLALLKADAATAGSPG